MEVGMLSCAKQQLVFAVEDACTQFDPNTPCGDICSQNVKSTLNEVKSLLIDGVIDDDTCFEDFVASQLLTGIVKGFSMSDRSIQFNKVFCAMHWCTVAVPLQLGFKIISELRLEGKFVELLLKESPSVSSYILSTIGSHIANIKETCTSSIIYEIWNSLLTPNTWTQLYSSTQDFSQYDKGDWLQLVHAAANLTYVYLDAFRERNAMLDVFGKLLPTLEDCLFRHKITWKILTNLMDLRSVIDSQFVEKDTINQFWNNLHKSHVKIKKLFESKIIDDVLPSLVQSRGSVLDFELKEARLKSTIAFYQMVMFDNLSPLRNILWSCLENDIVEKHASVELERALTLMDTIYFSPKQDLPMNDSLFQKQVSLLLLLGDCSVWDLLEARNLSDKEAKGVLELVCAHSLSLSDHETVTLCIKKLFSKWVKWNTNQFSEKEYLFWKMIVRYVMNGISIDNASLVMAKCILPVSPGISIFWVENLDQGCKQNFDDKLKTVLNQTTKDDNRIFSCLAQMAVECPYNLLQGIIMKGLSSLSEAKVCSQIVNEIWGLKGLIKDNQSKPLLHHLLLDICKEKSPNCENAAEIAVATTDYKELGRSVKLTPCDLVDHFVMPNLAEKESVLFGLALYVLEGIFQLPDYERVCTSATYGKSLAVKLCHCLAITVNLLTHDSLQEDKQQRKRLKLIVKKLQCILGNFLKMKGHRNVLLMVLQENLDFRDCWQTIYVADLLKELHAENLVKLPAELNSCLNGQTLDICQGTLAVQDILASICNVTTVSVEQGIALISRIRNLDGIQWKHVILALTKVLPSIEICDITGITTVLLKVMSLADNDQLYSLLPNWIPRRCPASILCRVCLVSIVSHATSVILKGIKADSSLLIMEQSKYSTIVKQIYLDNVILEDLEVSCLLLLLVFQQSLLIICEGEGDSHSHAIAFEIVHLYLDLLKKNKSREMKMALYGRLLTSVCKIGKGGLRILLLQRVNDFAKQL